MEPETRRTDLPVLLLHNLDSSWDPAEVAEALQGVESLKSALTREGHAVAELPVESTDLAGALKTFKPRNHIVFNWCEELPGVPRSDGAVVQTLEKLGYAYTGSPPEVLELSWDKASVKELLDRERIVTPAWQICSQPAPFGWERFPAIVKPAFEHSSRGIDTGAVVLDPRELRERIAFVRDEYRQPVLVEDFIDGREFHVTIWGNGTAKMLPPAEMDFSAFDNPRDRLCTFASKFAPGSRHYEKIELRIPAELDRRQTCRLERTAIRAYNTLGCRDYARIDLRLRNGVFYVLDINPNADIGPDTSLACAAEAAGLTYGIFGSRLVNLAAQRHPLFGCPAWRKRRSL